MHGAGWIGDSAALSSDGQVALLGAPGRTVNGLQSVGAAYSFSRTASGAWNTTAVALAPSNGGEVDKFGYAVAINADGSVALVGALQPLATHTCRALRTSTLRLSRATARAAGLRCSG